MRRKNALLLGAAASCALLVSCGGGGGSPSPAPTPTPTGTPTPSPTPTPTPTPTLTDYDFSKAFTSTAVNTSYIYAYFTPDNGNETWNEGALQDGVSKITYNVAPESVAFTWPDSTALMTFVAADRQADTATLRSYLKGTEGIVLELPFEHVLRVSYQRKQDFVRETVPGSLRSTRVSIFFNGVNTSSAITTNLTYTGTAQVVGGKPASTAPGVFGSPAATFTVAASDKKITGTFQIVETVNGTATVRAVLPISATVAANGSFGGDINDTANAFKGKFVGALAGPGREEMFIIFNVAHTDGREFLGSLIGS